MVATQKKPAPVCSVSYRVLVQALRVREGIYLLYGNEKCD